MLDIITLVLIHFFITMDTMESIWPVPEKRISILQLKE